MQINLSLGGYKRIERDSNLKDYQNMLPKSINFEGYILDDIIAILDSRYPSILSFNDISFYLESLRKLEQLLMLSN